MSSKRNIWLIGQHQTSPIVCQESCGYALIMVSIWLARPAARCSASTANVNACSKLLKILLLGQTLSLTQQLPDIGDIPDKKNLMLPQPVPFSSASISSRNTRISPILLSQCRRISLRQVESELINPPDADATDAVTNCQRQTLTTPFYCSNMTTESCKYFISNESE